MSFYLKLATLASSFLLPNCGSSLAACVFLPAPSTPGVDTGVQWLLQPSLPLTPPAPEAVAAVAAALHGSSSARPPLPHSPPSFSCVSPASCAALRAHVDRAHLLAAVHWATHLSLHGRSRRTTTPSNKFLLQFTTWQRRISAPMAVTWLLPPPKRLLQRKRL